MGDAGRLPPAHIPTSNPVVNPPSDPVAPPVGGPNPPANGPGTDVLGGERPVPAPGDGSRPNPATVLELPAGGSVTSRASAAPTGGAAQIGQIRTALASVPEPMKGQLLSALNDPGFVRFQRAKPDVM